MKNKNELNNKKVNKKSIIYLIIFIIICLSLFVIRYNYVKNTTNLPSDTDAIQINIQNTNEIPQYSGQLAISVNNNNPTFEEQYFTNVRFIKLSDVDEKKRTHVAFANLCYDYLPSKEITRENISNVYTTGWSDKKYDNIPGKNKENNLYNKSHIIAFSLIGNCGEDIYKNLFTGTHDLNTKGMVRYENDITKYLKENPDKHVLYRVTPIYEGDNLLATGVQMEAESVEDRGKSLHFNVFIYNVQNGIDINYDTGESKKK